MTHKKPKEIAKKVQQKGDYIETLLKAIENLKRKKKIFYSEAHFQHSLAWEIHSLVDNKIEIILEKPFENNSSKNNHIDICLEKDNKIVAAIELKYKTKELDINLINDLNLNINLKKQGAQDPARYDFLKDIERLEQLKDQQDSFIGFALFLTNDQSYWTCPKPDSHPNYEEFSLKNGRQLSNEKKYNWSDNTSEGTKEGRTEGIKLKENYTLKWEKYLEYENGEFKYLLIKI